jgi:hypothetical protein
MMSHDELREQICMANFLLSGDLGPCDRAEIIEIKRECEGPLRISC